MHIDDLDTPCVLIDLDVMERNLRRMSDYCRTHGIALRPHTKTHKIPEVARLQLELGAVGITVAKTAEAEVMADAGLDDILIAYPIVTSAKAKRVGQLADRVRITVSLDSREAAEALSRGAGRRSVGVLVEFDAGMGRCGVSSPAAAIQLARHILELPGLKLLGLMFYPGQLLLSPEDQEMRLPEVVALVERYVEAFRRDGLPIEIVSGGSTPTAYRSHLFAGVTEIRPGMYPLYDRNMLSIGAARQEDCALTVLVTVVSTAVPDRAMHDGGSKTFSSDRLLAGDGRGCGLVLDDQETEFYAMSEEHGHLDITRADRRYRVGERLRILPNHVCSTINMHDSVYGIRNDRVERTMVVACRGRLS